MSFAYPWAFLLLLPWLGAVWRIVRNKRRGGLIFASASFRLPQQTKGWRYHAVRLLPWCFAIGVLFLIIAVAGPQTALSREVKHANALAVMMTVDVSGSMSALDLSKEGEEKTRLDVVKDTFAAFVEARPDDLIGLVTFGGYASTRSPLTADHRALLHTLSAVQLPNARGLDDKGRPVSDAELMTAIGDGLATALARIEKTEPKTKLIILLSDGESNAGITRPKEAAQAAKDLNIKVYTIGVGSRGYAPFKQVDAFGRTRIQRAMVNLDEQTLREIATTTGGSYYNVTTPDTLAKALESINALETTQIERQVYYRYKEHFKTCLLIGFVLIVMTVSLLMSIIRRPI